LNFLLLTAQAAEATDPETRDRYTQEGLRALRRYFLLIVYQAYLDDTQPDTFDNLVRFEAFVRKRPGLSSTSFFLILLKTSC
jgi:hypothetical protein